MATSFAEIKKAFFTQDVVIKALNKKIHKTLVRYGSLTRRIAQQSMRTRPYDKHSEPGMPPYAHGGRLLRKWILFYYDDKEKFTIVGPILFANAKAKREMVPRTMEKGGKISKIVKGIQVERTYEPRPAMKPAHDIAIEKVLPTFKSLTKSISNHNGVA